MSERSACERKRYLCKECKSLLYDPVQVSCGHRLCRSCAEPIAATCPAVCPCGEELDVFENGKIYFPDRAAKREIWLLSGECPCREWQGNLLEFKDHIQNCGILQVCRGPNQPAANKATATSPIIHRAVPVTILEYLHVLLHELEKVADRAITSQPTTPDHLPHQHHQSVQSSLLPNASLQHFTQRAILDDHSYIPSLAPVRIEEGSECRRDASSHAQLDTRGNLVQSAEIEDLGFGSTLIETTLKSALQKKDEEIAALRSSIANLEKMLQAKNAEIEDRDFRLSLIENCNYDGTMVWKIPQFSQRMADAQNGKYTSIFSLPFYTGRYGYKMCLRLYILGDGTGNNNYMSLFFVIMRGEFDNILPWPFSHKVTFRLISQAGGRDIVDTFQPDPMSSSFKKPQSDMNIASGCPRFVHVSHSELSNGAFIVEDTIFIKCVTE